LSRPDSAAPNSPTADGCSLLSPLESIAMSGIRFYEVERGKAEAS
jgi:hypothetical protein